MCAFVFLCRQKTAYEMRISDWSSDVCSSDLVNDRVAKGQALALIDPEQIDDQIRAGRAQLAASTASVTQARATLAQANATLARYQEVSWLSDGRVPAKTEMDAAIAERDRASGALKVAQANVA